MSLPQKWNPKGLREYLCNQQVHAPGRYTSMKIQELIDVLDGHRPLGPDGKHDNRHTASCGCKERAPECQAKCWECRQCYWVHEKLDIAHPYFGVAGDLADAPCVHHSGTTGR